MNLCTKCGQAIAKSGKPGRPATRCENCRGQSGATPPVKAVINSPGIDDAKSEGVAPPAAPSRRAPSVPRNPMLAHHKFKPEDHPTAWRWYRHCGLSRERHPS